MADDTVYRFDKTLNLAVSSSTASVVIGSAALVFGPPYIQPLPEEHPVYAMVGRIASSWAHVERLFDQIIWELAGLDGEKGACITAQLGSIPARCNVVIAQLTLFERTNRISTERLVAKATDLRNKSNSAGDPRNRAVHDPWYHYTEFDKSAQFRAMPTKDLRYGIYPVDKTELEKTLNSIREYSERASAFRTEVSALIASQKKSS